MDRYTSLRWLAATMLAIGLYCVLWPEALLLDRFWDRLPSRTALGYSLAAVFLGAGAVFLAESVDGVDRFRGVAPVGKAVGGLVLIGGVVSLARIMFEF